MVQPFVITFAGVPGSSKSIVAHYLSEVFGLPLFSNDNIRFEVREDLLAADLNQQQVLEEYKLRVKRRRQAMFARQRSFILDGSVDREWQTLQPEATAAGYRTFVIALELSKSFLERLYRETGRIQAIKELDDYLEQHNQFMQTYPSRVNLTISNDTFSARLEQAKAAVEAFIADKTT